MELQRICLHINGADRFVVCEPDKDTLAEAIRRLGLTGTKVGCGIGVCGACSIILNGEVVRSCTKKMKNIPEYSDITTIEGIGSPNYPHPLQLAWALYGGVQCGFCSPGFIVSAFGLLKQNPSPTREQVREWFYKHKNICRCTGYVPIVDAVMAAAEVMRGEKPLESLKFQNPEDGEYYGSRVVRPSALPKACGVVDYGDDIKMKMPSGTLHLALVQPKCTHHAKILGLDYSKALAMPGVVKVVTAADIKGTNTIDYVLGHKRSLANRCNWQIIADKKIIRYGDVVAVVAADTEEHARAAAKTVEVKLEQLPEYTDFISAAMPGTMEIHESIPNVYLRQPVLKGDGDTREIIENSAYSVEGSFYSTREPHLSIEGDSVQAYWGKDGMLTVQCKTQFVYGTLGATAGGVGLPFEKVRIIENPTGGSFGWAMNAHSFALAAACAVATNQPVTLTMSYEEHNHFSGKRAPGFFNARLACDKNGKITAIEADMGMDHGPNHVMSDTLAEKFVRFVGFPYNIPQVTSLCRVAYTNHNGGTAYRGFGSPQAFTCSEAIVDMLAEKADIDPFEFRYRNIAHEGDLTVNDYPYREYPMEGIMQAARPLYEKARQEQKAAVLPPHIRRGVGVACAGFSNTGGAMDSCTSDIELLPDGTFCHYGTWEEQGQGAEAGILVLTCEALKELHVTPEMIKIVHNDSKICPDSGPAGGSRSHLKTGNATIQACNQLLNAMRKEDGTYRTYDEMVAAGLPTKYRGLDNNAGYELIDLDPNTGAGDPSPTCMYGFQIAEVEVDITTGKTKVIRFSTVDDVGNIGNLTAVEGQYYGGTSHNIGFALSEIYEDCKKHNNIAACGVPSILDVPDEMPLVHCFTKRKWGPYGSSGCSELYQSAGHVAILNAINDAVGVRIHELPATPDKVKAGIDALERGEQPAAPAPYFLGSDLYDEIDDIVANPV